MVTFQNLFSTAIVVLFMSMSNAIADPPHGRSEVASLCQRVETFAGPVIACTIDPGKATMKVFLGDTKGQPLLNFNKLHSMVGTDGLTLQLAVNGGMYHADMTPVGLHIENGKILSSLNRDSETFGNFFLKPNGVFMLAGTQAAVLETEAFYKSAQKPDFATQSGPMLVIDNNIHPAFLQHSDSKHIRNGVGVDRQGRVILLLSEKRINFYNFASLFKSLFHCPNALFLDGTISGLYAPDIGRNDRKYPYGPMIGVVSQAQTR